MLTLPSISFTFGVELVGRSDRRAQVYNSQGALVSGLTISITEESTATDAIWRVNLSNVPTSFSPGKVVFDFADDATIRPAEHSLTGDMILALGELRSTQGVWTAPVDVERRLAAAEITLRLTGEERTARVLEVIAEVVEEVERETRRQFIADTADMTKPFDGSGTAELEIEEMVSLTSVKILGPQLYPFYTYTNVVLKYEGPGKPQNCLVIGHPGVSPYSRYGTFPLGRGNVEVTGKFGYAQTIPADLLNAATDECAYRLMREAWYEAAGRIVEFKSDGFGEHREYGRGVQDDLERLGGHQRYLDKLEFYTRKPKKRSRRSGWVMA